MRQNPHVRICGGLGSATALVYPTPGRCQCGAGVQRPTARQLGFQRIAAHAHGIRPNGDDVPAGRLV